MSTSAQYQSTTQQAGNTLEVLDQGDGTVELIWGRFTLAAAASYNVYVNGVLYENVTTQSTLVGGLQEASYSSSAVAATPNNSTRPQNMPPNGVVTNPGVYAFTVAAVVGGVEIAQISSAPITLQPTSIMLTTPMKRLWPFPNTGLD